MAVSVPPEMANAKRRKVSRANSAPSAGKARVDALVAAVRDLISPPREAMQRCRSCGKALSPSRPMVQEQDAFTGEVSFACVPCYDQRGVIGFAGRRGDLRRSAGWM